MVIPSYKLKNFTHIPLDSYARLPSGNVAVEVRHAKNGELTLAPQSKWGRFKVRVLSALGIETKAMRFARSAIYNHFSNSLTNTYGIAGMEAMDELDTNGGFPVLTANKIKAVLSRARHLRADQVGKTAGEFARILAGSNNMGTKNLSPNGLSYFKKHFAQALNASPVSIFGNKDAVDPQVLAKEIAARASRLDKLGLANVFAQASQQIEHSSVAILEGLGKAETEQVLENVNRLTSAFKTFKQVESQLGNAKASKASQTYANQTIQDFLDQALAKMSPEAIQAAKQTVPQMLEAATLAMRSRANQAKEPIVGSSDTVKMLESLAAKLGTGKPPPVDFRTASGLARLGQKMAMVNSFGGESKAVTGADKFLGVMRRDLGKFIRLGGANFKYSNLSISPLVRQIINPKTPAMARNGAAILKTYLDLEVEELIPTASAGVGYWREAAAMAGKLADAGIRYGSDEYQEKIKDSDKTKQAGDKVWLQGAVSLNKARMQVLAIADLMEANATKAGATNPPQISPGSLASSSPAQATSAQSSPAQATSVQAFPASPAKPAHIQLAQANLTRQMLRVYPWTNAHLNESPNVNESMAVLAAPRDFKMMRSPHSPLGVTWGIVSSAISQKYFDIRQETINGIVAGERIGDLVPVATKALGEVEVRDQSLRDFSRSEIRIMENGKPKSLTAQRGARDAKKVVEGLAQYIGNKKDLAVLASVMTQASEADMVSIEIQGAALETRIPSGDIPLGVIKLGSRANDLGSGVDSAFTLEKINRDEYNISWSKPMHLGSLNFAVPGSSDRMGTFDILSAHNETQSALNSEVINLKRKGNSWDVSFPQESIRYDAPMNESLNV